MSDQYSQILNGIRENISSKTAIKSISPSDVGGSIEDVFKFLYQKISGIASGLPAGLVGIWPGPSSTFPTNSVAIPDSQQWYNIADYPEAYAALGGSGSVWGINVSQGTFSIPYGDAGRALAFAGTDYELGKKYGAFTHKLTAAESGIPDHFHHPVIDGWGVQKHGIKFGSDADSIIGGEDQDLDTGQVKDGAKDASEAHSILSPILPFNFFFVLKDSGAEISAQLNEILSSMPAISMGVIQLSETAYLPIPAGTWLKDVHIFVLSGNPTINIPDLNTGYMTDSLIYRYPADKSYPLQQNLEIQITGACSIKVQLIKYNI